MSAGACSLQAGMQQIQIESKDRGTMRRFVFTGNPYTRGILSVTGMLQQRCHQRIAGMFWITHWRCSGVSGIEQPRADSTAWNASFASQPSRASAARTTGGKSQA